MEIKFMKFIVSVLVLLAVTVTAAVAQQQTQPIESCAAQIPWGEPPHTKQNVTPICRMAYLALHDNQAKIPVWVSYVLTHDRAMGCYLRENTFAPDFSIPRDSRAELKDYVRSGYDMGHVANNADMSWSYDVQRESFILSNMYPQLPSLNRGLWKALETATRSWAWGRQTELTIMSGGIYDIIASKKIGEGRVVVPHAFWKIIVDNKTHETLAFIFPHQERLGSDLKQVQTTVTDVERALGGEFAVPGDKHALPSIWPVFSRAMAIEKRKVCKNEP
jgi:endonuclease G, mitochondrial